MSQPRLELDLDIDQYHAIKNCLSKSMLVDLLPPSCPAKFKYNHIDGGSRKENPSLRIGSAVHMLALEPQIFERHYYVLPRGVARNERHKKYQEHLEQAEGKTTLSQKDYKSIIAISNALRNDKTALKLLDFEGLVESSIFWEEQGLSFKCRPDFMRSDGIIVDIKTTNCAAQKAFEKIADSKHYALSVALTARGYEALYGKPLQNYIFLCVETEPPYLVEAYDTFRQFEVFGTNYRDVGEKILDNAINIYKSCITNNFWPKYNKSPITVLGLPPYRKKFLETGEM